MKYEHPNTPHPIWDRIVKIAEQAMSFTFPAIIYLHGVETTVEVEASYYQADPEVGYMTPWIEIDLVTDGNGDNIYRELNEEQKAQLLNAAADECGCINEDRKLESRL